MAEGEYDKSKLEIIDVRDYNESNKNPSLRWYSYGI